MIQRMVHLYRQAFRGLPRPVWLLAGVMLINRCGTMVLPYMTLYMTQQLHYSVAEAGIVMAVFGAGSFCGTFLGGRLTDRFGFYYIQLFSLLFSGVALLALQLVTNFYGLCGSLFLFSLLGDAFRPANQSAVAYYTDPETRTRGFSLNRLSINLGWSIGGGLGGLLASINYDLLFWADGLTCLLAGIVLWISLPVPTRLRPSAIGAEAVSATEPGVGSPYRDGLFVGFVVCCMLYFVVFMQLFSIVPLFFEKVLLMNERAIGLTISLNGLLIVFFEMAFVYSTEQRSTSPFTYMLTGILLATLSYGVLAGASLFSLNGLAAALLFTIIVTFSEILAMPFFQSFVGTRANPVSRGQYFGLYAMGGSLAQVIAPALGSFDVATFGFQTHWLVITGISLLSAVGFWQLKKRLERESSRPASSESLLTPQPS